MDVKAVEAIVRRLGVSGTEFQFSEVREALGVPASDRNSVARIFNEFRRLEGTGIVKEVPSGRKRNRSYQLAAGKETGEGRAVTEKNGNESVRPASGGPDRLARMERRLDGIERVLERLEERVAELARALK